jgi:ATP-dependent RNA helicase DeaD
VPQDCENYVHRTGRIGADGIAIAFVTPEQGQHLTDIEMFINKMIPEDRVDGFEAYTPKAARLQSAPPEPPKVVQPVFGRRVKRYSNRL